MFKRFIPATFAALLVFTGCTATPTAAPDIKSSGADARLIEGVRGDGSKSSGENHVGQNNDVTTTSSADSSTVGRGGGAIGSGN